MSSSFFSSLTTSFVYPFSFMDIVNALIFFAFQRRLSMCGVIKYGFEFALGRDGAALTLGAGATLGLSNIDQSNSVYGC